MYVLIYFSLTWDRDCLFSRLRLVRLSRPFCEEKSSPRLFRMPRGCERDRLFRVASSRVHICTDTSSLKTCFILMLHHLNLILCHALKVNCFNEVFFGIFQNSLKACDRSSPEHERTKQRKFPDDLAPF